MRYRTDVGDYPSTMVASAHAVLAALRARRPEIGRKKAQKLLYYCQGHHLAAYGEPLFRERISAWDMGPVVGEIWFAEKNDKEPEFEPLGDEASLNTVGYVLSRYGALSGDELERLTHTESPWIRADHARPEGGSTPIPPEWIEEYFRQLVDDDDGDDSTALDREAARRLVRGARTRLGEPALPDEPDVIGARIAALKARTGSRGST